MARPRPPIWRWRVTAPARAALRSTATPHATAQSAASAYSLWTAAAKPAPAHRLRPGLRWLLRRNLRFWP